MAPETAIAITTAMRPLTEPLTVNVITLTSA
jgi:hypothetical protein